MTSTIAEPYAADAGTDRPLLLVASTGGHLEELVRLRGRLGSPTQDCAWATFEDDQSISLLEGELVHHVQRIGPRGYRAAALTTADAVRIVRRGGFGAVISTGSGIALPFFAAARMLGIPCHYIESAARSAGPSLTGKVLSQVPGVRLYSQYPARWGSRWAYRGSLFDGFERAEQPTSTSASLSRVVVTLGTMRGYGFRRAVQRLTRLLPEVTAPDVEVLWQTGATDVSGLGIVGRDLVPASELRAAVADADLVVAHAGVGSSLVSLDAGRAPVLLPRRAAHGEHVDDHQVFISAHLDDLGIAVGRDVENLTAHDLVAAASVSVRTAQRAQTFVLQA